MNRAKTRRRNTDLKLNNDIIEECDSCKHLSTTIEKQVKESLDIKHRTSQERRAIRYEMEYGSLKRLQEDVS